jgi:hypothetical protein
MHTLAFNIRPMFLENFKGLRIIFELNPNLFKDSFGVVLNDFRPLIRHNIIEWHLTDEIWSRHFHAATTSCGPAGITSTTFAATFFS